jgi:hypothetical protein
LRRDLMASSPRLLPCHKRVLPCRLG